MAIIRDYQKLLATITFYAYFLKENGTVQRFQMVFNVFEAIAIGDGYNDILGAKAAGIKYVLTLWYVDEGVSREADYVINELKKVIFDSIRNR